MRKSLLNFLAVIAVAGSAMAAALASVVLSADARISLQSGGIAHLDARIEQTENKLAGSVTFEKAFAAGSPKFVFTSTQIEAFKAAPGMSYIEGVGSYGNGGGMFNFTMTILDNANEKDPRDVVVFTIYDEKNRAMHYTGTVVKGDTTLVAIGI